MRIPSSPRRSGGSVAPAPLFLVSLRWLPVVSWPIRGRWGTLAVASRSSRWRGLFDVYLHAFIKGIRRIQDDPIVGAQSLEHFQRSAVVAPNRQLLQMRLVIAIHHHGAQP